MIKCTPVCRVASPRTREGEGEKRERETRERTIFAGVFSSDAAGPNPVNDFARVVYDTVRFNCP